MDAFSSNTEILIFSIFAVLPAVIWLLFFLKEDNHPEPARMIVKTFLFGSLFAFPVILIFTLTEPFLGRFYSFFFAITVITPFLEETAKYLSVRISSIKDPECDEPVDFMIYAVTAALGFATVENIIFLLPIDFFSLKEITMGSFFRFIGGTFLHAIASGFMGFFLAMSVLKKKRLLIFLGLFLAMIIHGAYNFLILTEGVTRFTPLFLSSFFVLLLLCFWKLRNTDFCD